MAYSYYILYKHTKTHTNIYFMSICVQLVNNTYNQTITLRFLKSHQQIIVCLKSFSVFQWENETIEWGVYEEQSKIQKKMKDLIKWFILNSNNSTILFTQVCGINLH